MLKLLDLLVDHEWRALLLLARHDSPLRLVAHLGGLDLFCTLPVVVVMVVDGHADSPDLQKVVRVLTWMLVYVRVGE